MSTMLGDFYGQPDEITRGVSLAFNEVIPGFAAEEKLNNFGYPAQIQPGCSFLGEQINTYGYPAQAHFLKSTSDSVVPEFYTFGEDACRGVSLSCQYMEQTNEMIPQPLVPPMGAERSLLTGLSYPITGLADGTDLAARILALTQQQELFLAGLAGTHQRPTSVLCSRCASEDGASIDAVEATRQYLRICSDCTDAHGDPASVVQNDNDDPPEDVWALLMSADMGLDGAGTRWAAD